MPIIKSAIEQEKVIGAICNAASFMAKCGIDRETTSKSFAEVIRNTENLSNFVLGNHSNYCL